MGYNCQQTKMRHVVQTFETESDGCTTVTVIAQDEYGNQYVGTSHYYTLLSKDDAYREATKMALGA